MNRKNFQENPSRHKYLVLLMALSLTFLIILQAAWIRSEYRSAASAFRRETNLVFRNTIMQIADSLFMVHFVNLPDSVNTIGKNGPNIRERIDIVRLSSDPNNIINGNLDETLPGFEEKERVSDTTNIRIQLSRTNVNHDQKLDTNRVVRTPRHFRFMSGLMTDSINPDTIGILYREALHYRFRHLPMEIIHKQVNWMEMDWNRPGRQSNDSLPFATSFYPVGPRHVYAANFESVRGFLILELLPQIGFSLFTTGLIIGLFILIIRNLNAQQRLINQKNDFIGNMTHELKTPVSTVGVALEAMKHFEILKNPKKAEEYIDIALQELERLSLMTDKILKTSIYDYKADIKNNMVTVDLCLLAQKVYGSFRLLAEKNQVDFTLHYGATAWISGHPEHLTQMIYNLVDNAFKYAGSRAKIVMTITQNGDLIELKLADNGPGIAPEHHRKIFEKFYRVPSGNIHTVKGYGLGLCYVEGVVKSHGGKVSLESQTGKGSVFTVSLPAIEAHGKN